MDGLGASKFNVGDNVSSRAIGSAGAFDGEIEEVRGYVGQSFSGYTYNVRSFADGKLWCRDDNDLTIIARVAA